MAETTSGTLRPVAIAVAAVALESYDLAVYALFAGALAQLFFPLHDPTNALLLAVGTLGVGYVVRPIGGVLLGAYADKAGRKAAIALTVLLLSISTGVIGLLPTYAAIGVAAPLLLVTARLAQGVAAGGATAGSISYLIEAAPRGRRGFFASFQQTSQIGALLISAAVGALITNSLAPAEVQGWGWRVPFLIALILGPLGLYIRKRLPEPEIYEQAKQTTRTPIAQAALRNWRGILTGFGLSCLWNVSAFILLFFMPTYAQRVLQIAPGDAFLSSTISTLVLFLLCPFIGLLSDRVGRKPLMLVGSVLLVLTAYPLFRHMDATRGFASLLTVQVVLAVLIAFYTAPVSAMLGELFPTGTRSTGLAIAYNLSTVLFGAFGPLIVTWLIEITGNPLAPSFYVMAAAAFSTIALLTVRDRTREALDG